MQFHLPTDPLPPADDAISIISFRDFYAFEQHVKTCRGKRGLEMIPQWYDQPVFYFSNAQSLVRDGAEITVPQGCNELDYELELGIVIGKPGRNIAVEDAWDHIAGFTIVNDFSARDLQRNEMAVGLGPSKGKDFATAVGPNLVSVESLRNRIDADNKIDLVNDRNAQRESPKPRKCQHDVFFLAANRRPCVSRRDADPRRIAWQRNRWHRLHSGARTGKYGWVAQAR